MVLHVKPVAVALVLIAGGFTIITCDTTEGHPLLSITWISYAPAAKLVNTLVVCVTLVGPVITYV